MAYYPGGYGGRPGGVVTAAAPHPASHGRLTSTPSYHGTGAYRQPSVPPGYPAVAAPPSFQGGCPRISQYGKVAFGAPPPMPSNAGPGQSFRIQCASPPAPSQPEVLMTGFDGLGQPAKTSVAKPPAGGGGGGGGGDEGFAGLKKSSAEVQMNLASVGLTDPALSAFINRTEFISLGNYCAVSYATEALGLRKAAGPLDWVRSPIHGLIQLFSTGFSNFTTYGHTKQTEHGPAFMQTQWGGSFWHHDITQEKIKASQNRRCARIMGKGDVPPTKPRCFVRTLNGSNEVAACVDLYRTLARVFSQTEVYLLILMDMQDPSAQPTVRLAGPEGDNILFHRIPISDSMSGDINVRAKGYFPAIATAVRYWATRQGNIGTVPSIQALEDLIDPYEGGDPALALYAPTRLRRKGQQPGQSVANAMAAAAQAGLQPQQALPPGVFGGAMPAGFPGGFPAAGGMPPPPPQVNTLSQFCPRSPQQQFRGVLPPGAITGAQVPGTGLSAVSAGGGMPPPSYGLPGLGSPFYR